MRLLRRSSLFPYTTLFRSQMTDFDCRENGEYVLEENREQGSYRWVTLETRRVCTGYVNPPELEDADKHHERVLELAPYHLDLDRKSTRLNSSHRCISYAVV